MRRRTGAAIRSDKERSDEERRDEERSDEERSNEERSNEESDDKERRGEDRRGLGRQGQDRRGEECRGEERRGRAPTREKTIKEMSIQARSDAKWLSTAAFGCPLHQRPYRTAAAWVAARPRDFSIGKMTSSAAAPQPAMLGIGSTSTVADLHPHPRGWRRDAIVRRRCAADRARFLQHSPAARICGSRLTHSWWDRVGGLSMWGPMSQAQE